MGVNFLDSGYFRALQLLRIYSLQCYPPSGCGTVALWQCVLQGAASSACQLPSLLHPSGCSRLGSWRSIPCNRNAGPSTRIHAPCIKPNCIALRVPTTRATTTTCMYGLAASSIVVWQSSCPRAVGNASCNWLKHQ